MATRLLGRVTGFRLCPAARHIRVEAARSEVATWHASLQHSGRGSDFLYLRLMVRLRALGTAPAADLMEYGRALVSLRSFRDAE